MNILWKYFRYKYSLKRNKVMYQILKLLSLGGEGLNFWGRIAFWIIGYSNHWALIFLASNSNSHSKQYIYLLMIIQRIKMCSKSGQLVQDISTHLQKGMAQGWQLSLWKKVKNIYWDISCRCSLCYKVWSLRIEHSSDLHLCEYIQLIWMVCKVTGFI